MCCAAIGSTSEGSGMRIAVLGTGAVGTTLGTRLVETGHEVRPVSYTHLRAHETVLDLVCRLLLAKKKHTTHNTHTTHTTYTIATPLKQKDYGRN